MPEILERPDVEKAPPRRADLEVKIPVREMPPHAVVSRRRPTRYVRWMGWLLVAVATSAALLLGDGGETETITDLDGSFATNEALRFSRLEPGD